MIHLCFLEICISFLIIQSAPERSDQFKAQILLIKKVRIGMGLEMFPFQDNAGYKSIDYICNLCSYNIGSKTELPNQSIPSLRPFSDQLTC